MTEPALQRGWRRLLVLLCLPALPLLVNAAVERLDVEVLPVQTTGAGPRPVDGDALNIATINIAHGRGDSLNQLLVSEERTRENLAAIAEALRRENIHIAALQEADAPSWWSGNFDHSAYIARSGQFGWLAQMAHAQLGVGIYGTAVLSTLPLRAALGVSFEPSPPTARKGFTLAEVYWQTETTGIALDVISIHMDFSRKSVRQAQLRALRHILRDRDNPLVIMGDFNSTAIARQLQREEGEEGRHLHTVGADSPDYHSYKNERLDWILVSEELEFIDYHTSPEMLSDHKLVTARLRLRPAPARQSE